ncbi:MAG: hypothetical protein F6K54_39010 [Okeania sp. SIO3B5]|nr:hypothetical protein [Okeania sp. SIO3B5]
MKGKSFFVTNYPEIILIDIILIFPRYVDSEMKEEGISQKAAMLEAEVKKRL